MVLWIEFSFKNYLQKSDQITKKYYVDTNKLNIARISILSSSLFPYLNSYT